MPKQTLSDAMAEATANGDAKPAARAAKNRAAKVTTPAPAGDPVAVVEIAVDRIAPSPHNPRRTTGDLKGLKSSIATVGILEPLLVEADGDNFHLLPGWRRVSAADELGLATVPCIVRSTPTDSQRIEIMLIENLQRSDLEPIEEATGFHALTDLGLAQREIAERVGCNQSHVSKRLTLLELAPEVQAAVGRAHLRDALAKKVAAPLALDTLSRAVIDEGDYSIDPRSTLALLGPFDETAKYEEEERAWTAALAADATRLAVAGVLDCGVFTIENSTHHIRGWSEWHSGEVRVLYGFLEATGYELDEFEREQLKDVAE